MKHRLGPAVGADWLCQHDVRLRPKKFCNAYPEAADLQSVPDVSLSAEHLRIVSAYYIPTQGLPYPDSGYLFYQILDLDLGSMHN